MFFFTDKKNLKNNNLCFLLIIYSVGMYLFINFFLIKSNIPDNIIIVGNQSSLMITSGVLNMVTG